MEEEMTEPTLEENQPLCSAVSPSGDWTCSLIKGHKQQQHVAYESHEEGGDVLEMWCDDPQPAPESEGEAFWKWAKSAYSEWFNSFGSLHNSDCELRADLARAAWDARARLSAGGK
jgi:hypothetical protein